MVGYDPHNGVRAKAQRRRTQTLQPCTLMDFPPQSMSSSCRLPVSRFPMNVRPMLIAAIRRRVPLLGGSVLAALLHALVLLLLYAQLNHSNAPLPPLKQMLTIIELRPRPDAPAVSQLPRPATAPPKKSSAARPARKFSAALPQRSSPHLPSDVPMPAAPAQLPPAPPQPAAGPPVPAPAPAPPIVASAGRVAPIPTDYLWDVSRTISRRHIYPLSARDAHQQGTVVIHIHLRRDGTVLDASLVRSSGYAVLDEAARQEILGVGKFAELPEEFSPGQADFAIDQPVTFRLR